tara:strand:- start:622 stop:825 length:204 start_codon:yes stop_codon:yes gene_type:complete
MKPKIREKQFGPLVIGLSVIVAIILMSLSCVFVAWKPEQPKPCCEEEVCEEEPLPPLSPFDLISEEE